MGKEDMIHVTMDMSRSAYSALETLAETSTNGDMGEALRQAIAWALYVSTVRSDGGRLFVMREKQLHEIVER